MPIDPIDPINLFVHHLSPRPNRIGQLVQYLHRRIPRDTSVCDADTLLEACWSFWWNLLISFVDVRLDHHSDNGFLAFPKLITYRLSDLGLVVMILLRIT